MPIEPVGGASAVAAATQTQSTKESFASVAAKVSSPPREPGAANAVPALRGDCAQPAATAAAPAVTKAEAARVAERVLAAQQKLDKVLELAQSGRTFNTAELIALQAHVYGASQEIDLASKVVEKATSGLKTLLQTQL